MNRIDKDVMNTILVMNEQFEENYERLYFQSNELLHKIFSNFDLEGKDVLTVAGSGDQAFHCYKNGAKSIDLFDKNPLTIYYFYLRRWVVEYLNLFYPDKSFTSKDIKRLLKKVIVRSDYENDSIEYWEKLIKEKDFRFTKLFWKDLVQQKQSNDFNDLFLIKNRLSDNFSFYNLDITKYLISNKKYDVIITSNISDYYGNAFTLAGYEDNLKGMLKDDGIIVCSNLSQDRVGLIEELVFEDDFTITPMPEDMSWGRKMSLGYVYKKK